MNRIRSIAFMAIGLLAMPSALESQTTGTILGFVGDPTGAAVAGASVKVENTGTGLMRNTAAGADGAYIVSSLPPGTYRVTVQVEGFRTFSQSGVTLEVGQNARVDARLSLGAVSENVEVTANALAVDTQSTALGTTVDNRRLVSLPLNGRNVLALMKLQPGVGTTSLPTTVTSSRSGPSFNISGAKSNDHNVMLDGTTFVTAKQNVAQNLPSPDALEEFRLLTNTFAAEYGRSPGGVVLAVTKSGTNEYHGSAWEFLRNDALNARTYFAGSKPFLRQNQFGASAGGPVRLPGYQGRNRTFFFASYQGLRIRQQELGTFFPLNEAERQGNFTQSSRAIQDPLTNQPFPGNVIPPARLDPMARNLLNAYVLLPNQPDGRNLSLVSRPIAGNQVTLRGDHKLTARDHVTFRHYRNRDAANNFGGGDSYSLASYRGNTVSTYTLAETHMFSPTLLNEFRASYTRIESDGPPSAANKTPRELGGSYEADGPLPYAPAISVQGRFSISPTQPWFEVDSLVQVDNKTSWFRGKHAVKFGGMLLSFRTTLRTYVYTSGTFNFDGTFSRDAASDFLLGRPVRFQQQSVYDNSPRGGDAQFFFQDDYKVHRRLTLNLGVRYELRIPWKERFDRVSVIRPGQQSTRFRTAPPGLIYPGDAGIPRSLVETERNNFAPRFGFAWDVFGHGRTAVRGAYGVFYDPETAFFIDRTYEQPPFQRTVALSPPTSLQNPYGTGTSPFPYQLDLKDPVYVYPIAAYNLSPDVRDAYVQQFNLNLQQQFGPDVVVQAGYVGRVGHRLSSSREINASVFGPGATAANAQQRRPYYPQYFSSIATLFTDGNSNYHSLQSSLEKRFSRNYTVQVAYTWSKSIDERSAAFGGPNGPPNPDNYRAGERGMSDFDQRHLLRINGVWDLPKFKDRNALVSTVIGGWRLAPMISYSSGTPFSVVIGRDIALTGGGRGLGSQRPNLAGEAVLDPGRPRGELISRYFNTAAFAFPATGQFGNSGRNNLIGPGSFETDLAIMKRFYLPKERYGSFEFRGEIFGLFNNPNLGNPTTSMASPAFGQILSASGSRVVQFGLRYDF